MSPTHTPDCYFTLPSHLITIASVRSLGMLSQFHWRHRSLFSNFCHMCRLQRWQLSSSCGDSTPQSERGGRARARLERGRATSLAAVIGQEVGCLDLRALLSQSPPHSLPTPSPPSGQSVPLRFASICPPPLHTRPRSPSSHSVSIFLSELTSYCRSVDHGLGRLDAKPYLPRVSVSKKVWNFLNGSNLWKDTGIPAAQERLIVEMVCLRWVTGYHSLFVDQ